MALDANGIWQYTEAETVSPVSTMLNRLAGSVSGVVAPLIPHQSGAQVLSSMADADCHVWVRGGLAGMSFQARIGTATHNTVIGTLAAAYRPLWTETIQLVPNSTVPNNAFIQISSSGTITYLQYGSSSSTTIVRGSGVWPKVA